MVVRARVVDLLFWRAADFAKAERVCDSDEILAKTIEYLGSTPAHGSLAGARRYANQNTRVPCLVARCSK